MMSFQLFDVSDDDSLNTVLVSVIAEIALVCATMLVLFAYLQLPISVATAISLFVFFVGSLLCWKGFVQAQGVFFLSVTMSELVLVNFFDWLLPGFLIFDFLAVLVFMRLWQPKSEEPEI